jgi:hypothetical protein
LSKINVSIRFALSSTDTFRKITPSLAAALNAATSAVGLDKMIVHGHEIINRDIALSTSLVKKSRIPAIISIDGVYHEAYLLTSLMTGVRLFWA